MPQTKPALRRAALAARRALPPAEATRRSAVLAELLFRHFPVAEWRWLHLYLPLTATNEPDTWPTIRRVWAELSHLRLAVPVVQADNQTLKHYELTTATPLAPNRWGIPEPAAVPRAVPAAEVPPAAFDAVLVPLLAVDETGHRVGYGGGYYDRFLAQCRPDCRFIGLSLLDGPPAPALPDARPSDVRLHACLTPAGVRWF